MKMKILTRISLIVYFLLLTFYFSLLTAQAAVPHLINYQGRLTDKDNKPLEGAYSITFRIYDAETAGNLLWEEAQAGVVIQRGIFSTLLGSVTNLGLAFDKPYFLEIKVNSEVMSPRQRIASVAYAIRAETADGVRGAENLFLGTGNIGIGTTDPKAKLDVSGSGTIRLAPQSSLPVSPQEGTICYYANDKRLYLYTSAGWKVLATAAVSISYPDEKRYTCSGGSGPCNLGTQVHFTWSNVSVPAIIGRLRVKYQWSSGNFANDYYSHNIQVLVNGNAIESFAAYQTGWVDRDNTYNVQSYLRYDGTDTIKIQLTDTTANEEDWYSFRNTYFEFQ